MSLDALFPPVERVIFKKNPLVEVIWRATFEPLDDLSAHIPAFQHELSDILKLAGVLPDAHTGEDVLWLVSSNGLWRAQLAASEVRLTTTVYERWEEFSQTLHRVLDALRVAVPELERLNTTALRYVDVLDRKLMGCEGVPWTALLTGPLVQWMHTPGTLDAPLAGLAQRVKLELADAQSLLLDLRWHVEHDEDSFLIACVFTHEAPLAFDEVRHAHERLRAFTGRVFRSFLTERAAQALEPEPIAEA